MYFCQFIFPSQKILRAKKWIVCQTVFDLYAVIIIFNILAICSQGSIANCFVLIAGNLIAFADKFLGLPQGYSTIPELPLSQRLHWRLPIYLSPAFLAHCKRI